MIRIAAMVHPRSPLAHVALVLGVLALGMLMPVVPFTTVLWRLLLPQGYVPWMIGSNVLIYVAEIAVTVWLSVR